MRKKSFKKIVLSIVLVLSLSMQGSIQSVFATGADVGQNVEDIVNTEPGSTEELGNDGNVEGTEELDETTDNESNAETPEGNETTDNENNVETPEGNETPGIEDEQGIIEDENKEFMPLLSPRVDVGAEIPCGIKTYQDLYDLIDASSDDPIGPIVEIVLENDIVIEETSGITVKDTIKDLYITSEGEPKKIYAAEGTDITMFTLGEDVNVEFEDVIFEGTNTDNSSLIKRTASSGEVGTIFLKNCEVRKFGAYDGEGTGSTNGAIFTTGKVEIWEGLFENNYSTGSGGAVKAGTIIVGSSAKFVGNKAYNGGAISASIIDIEVGRFENNEATHFGGAIYLEGEGTSDDKALLNLKNSTLIGNSAETGGAVYSLVHGDADNYYIVELINCTMNNNTAKTNGGAFYSSAYEKERISVESSDFKFNTAGENGGGIYSQNRIDISGSFIEHNTVEQDGGGIYGGDSVVISDNTEITNNTAVNGGGIYGLKGIKLSNSHERYITTIADNTAKEKGGGIYWTGLSGLNLDGVKVCDNHAIEGGAVYIEDLVNGVKNLRIDTINTAGTHAEIDSVFQNNTADFEYVTQSAELEASTQDRRTHKTYSKNAVGDELTFLFNNYDINGDGDVEVGVKFYTNHNDSDETVFKTLNVVRGTKISDPDSTPSKSGYKFKGWSDSRNGSTGIFDFETETVTSNLNLYAQWSKNDDGGGDPGTNPKEKYTVTYDSNGGHGIVVDGTKYNKDDKAEVKENEFTNEKHTFISWNTEKDGSGTKYNAGDKIKISDDVTLYAVWKSDDSTDPVTPDEPDTEEPETWEDTEQPDTPGTLVPGEDDTYTEFDENNTPLGTWHQDPITGEWIFTPYVSLGENPSTGDASNVFGMGMAFILALGGIAFIIKKKEEITK